MADDLLAALGITRKSDEADIGCLEFTYRFQAARLYKLIGPEKGGKHQALQLRRSAALCLAAFPQTAVVLLLL